MAEMMGLWRGFLAVGRWRLERPAKPVGGRGGRREEEEEEEEREWEACHSVC